MEGGIVYLTKVSCLKRKNGSDLTNIHALRNISDKLHFRLQRGGKNKYSELYYFQHFCQENG
jgi:hypothetical protein